MSPESLVPMPARSFPLKGMRAAIAHQMASSLQNSAQFTLHRRVPAPDLDRVREDHRDASGRRPSINDIVMCCVARSLVQHPDVNATIQDDVISQWAQVNLGFAVALDPGLVVPVVRDAHLLDVAGMRREIARLSEAAQSRSLTFADLADGTFTVTNLGGLNIDFFTPIINPPQVAILGVGRVDEDMLSLSLTIDHRALDGAPGARFLNTVAERLAEPGSSLAEMEDTRLDAETATRD